MERNRENAQSPTAANFIMYQDLCRGNLKLKVTLQNTPTIWREITQFIRRRQRILSCLLLCAQRTKQLAYLYVLCNLDTAQETVKAHGNMGLATKAGEGAW